MTASPLTLDEDTQVDPVAPVPVPAVEAVAATDPGIPLRRRHRDPEPERATEDRIPALSALDSAAEFVLVVRDGDRLRVFSEGALLVEGPAGDVLEQSRVGADLSGLPIRIADPDQPSAPEADAAAQSPAGEEELPEQDPAEEVPAADSVDTTEHPAEDAPAAEVDESADEDVDDADELFAAFEEAGETNRVPGLTRGSSGAGLPEAAALAEPVDPEEYTSLAVVLPDGRRAAADHTFLIGRSPAPRPGDPAAELVTMPATLTDISRNHLELRVDGEGFAARDLGSTNGTVLLRPGAAPELVPTDEPVRLQAGDSLDLGGAATLVIEGVR